MVCITSTNKMIKKVCSFETLNIKFVYLVRISFVFSSVSPSRKAKVDGLRLGLAIPIMLSHCSAVAKLGKYSARGYQLKTYAVHMPFSC